MLTKQIGFLISSPANEHFITVGVKLSMMEPGTSTSQAGQKAEKTKSDGGIKVTLNTDGTQIRTMPDGSKVMPDGRKFKVMTSTSSSASKHYESSASTNLTSGSHPAKPVSSSTRPKEHKSSHNDCDSEEVLCEDDGGRFVSLRRDSLRKVSFERENTERLADNTISESQGQEVAGPSGQGGVRPKSIIKKTSRKRGQPSDTPSDENTPGPSAWSGQGSSKQPKRKVTRGTKSRTEKSAKFAETCREAGQPVRHQTTSKKHRELVNEPMGTKSTSFVPGIGKVTAKKLADKKYSKAFQLVGQFLVLNKSDHDFLAFLKEGGAKGTYADQACAAIKAWCEQHI